MQDIVLVAFMNKSILWTKLKELGQFKSCVATALSVSFQMNDYDVKLHSNLMTSLHDAKTVKLSKINQMRWCGP